MNLTIRPDIDPRKPAGAADTGEKTEPFRTVPWRQVEDSGLKVGKRKVCAEPGVVVNLYEALKVNDARPVPEETGGLNPGVGNIPPSAGGAGLIETGFSNGSNVVPRLAADPGELARVGTVQLSASRPELLPSTWASLSSTC